MPGPPAYQVRISNYAFSNLEEIHFYISYIDERPITANQVIDEIQKSILVSIPKYPFRYPECPARRTLKKMYRQAIVKNYKIIFKIEDNLISVIGVVHSSRSRNFIKRIPAKS
jgi:mRNA-degrading endonuclease RelE of RelBE toxin-antitoxin system